MFNMQIKARMDVHPNHFTLTIPSFWHTVSRDVREDLLEHFHEFGGKWDGLAKNWKFDVSAKTPIFKLLQALNVEVLMPSVAEAEKLEGRKALILTPPKKIMVQVPTDIVSQNTLAVRQVLERQYNRLEAEFKKLHMETGVCKTKMREILMSSVPSILSTGKN